MTGEPRYLPVLIAPELMEQWATRDTEGNRISWSLGEPDEDGFYTPTVTVHYDDNLRAEARAAALADVTAAVEGLPTFRSWAWLGNKHIAYETMRPSDVLAAIKALEDR